MPIVHADTPMVFEDKAVLVSACHEGVGVADVLLVSARSFIRQQVNPDGGRLDNARLNAHQHALHGLSWLATYVEALRQMTGYAERMNAQGRFGELGLLLTQVGMRL